MTEDICQEIKQLGMMGKEKMTMPLSNWTKKQPEFSIEVQRKKDKRFAGDKLELQQKLTANRTKAL